MAAAPVVVPPESPSTGHGTETFGFQRLQHVRAQRRARRYRLFFITTVVIALAVVGILGITSLRRASFDRLGSSSSSAPVGVKPAAASPAVAGTALGPPPVVVPPATRADAAGHEATQPPRLPADRRARALSGQGRETVKPARDERPDVETNDSTAVIDWLLNTSGTRTH